jgi:hypothetical protein
MQIDAYGPPSTERSTLALVKLMLTTGVAVYAGSQVYLDPSGPVKAVGRVVQRTIDGVRGFYGKASDRVKKMNSDLNRWTRESYA